MRLNVMSVIVICVLFAGAPVVALAGQEGLSSSTEINPLPGVKTMEPVSPGCNLITFEGLGDGSPIGVIPGPVNVTFGSSWLALIDADAGGNGQRV